MILRGHVFSQTLEMETGITVLTPGAAPASDAYRVIYLLHGLCGRSGDWLDYTMLPAYAEGSNAVFVMPEVARSFYTDMQYGQRFFTYVTEELPGICRNVFRIASERENTAVIGASMGGYGALKCALSKPEQYGACGAFSSACLYLKETLAVQRAAQERGDLSALQQRFGMQTPTDFQAMFGEDLDWRPDCEPLELAKKAAKGPYRPKFYLACGDKDLFRQDNLRFCCDLRQLGFDSMYEEWNGVHDWTFFNRALKKALDRLL